jgi:hypothetical protein
MADACRSEALPHLILLLHTHWAEPEEDITCYAANLVQKPSVKLCRPGTCISSYRLHGTKRLP